MVAFVVACRVAVVGVLGVAVPEVDVGRTPLRVGGVMAPPLKLPVWIECNADGLR